MLVTKEKSLAQWQASHPLLTELSNVHELFWFNPLKKPFAEIRECLPLQQNATEEAAQRLQRFAAYISLVFPETQSHEGLIESPLKPIPNYLKVINAKADFPVMGSLWLKCDSHLPISGSIKARGGIYEVLKYAEEVALSSGALTQEQCYSVLAEPAFKNLFAQHQIVVGSTGNLGLSIGIMAAKLGFSVTVHMSADARKWKKDLLRSKGVIVVEYEADYSKAVEEGRKQAEAQDKCHFVDDENSHDLFLGYSVAGQRLKAQMDQQGVIVDREHPLFVYLPCGVGGGPGGVAFGLKQAFGDNVHCFFAEPTHSPCMLLGMYTGLHDAVCVQDIGIDNKTCADGLAVGRASAFVGRFMQPLLTGLYTVEDNELYRQLACLRDAEDISLEPSALAGAVGPVRLTKELASQSANPFSNTQLKQATHLIWATGGSMVPKNESEVYYQMGKSVG